MDIFKKSKKNGRVTRDPPKEHNALALLRIKHDIRTARVAVDVHLGIHTEQIADLLRHEHLLRRAEIYDPARFHQDDLVAVARRDVQVVDGGKYGKILVFQDVHDLVLISDVQMVGGFV